MAEEENRTGECRTQFSGSIYHGGHDHYQFLTEDLFAHANAAARHVSERHQARGRDRRDDGVVAAR